MTVDAQSAHVELPAARTSPRDARRFLTRTLAQWHVGAEPTDTVCLLATELVTNSVLYAGTPIDLLVERWDSMVRVQVCDRSTQLPVARPHRSMSSLTGRGLSLVKDLSARWGVTPRDTGKSVWFELSTAAG